MPVQLLKVYCAKPINNTENFPNSYRKLVLFKELFYNGTKITNKQGNNTVLLYNGDIIQIDSFFKQDNDFLLLGKKCNILEPIYSYPESSHVLNISEINIGASDTVREYKVNDILCKGITIPYKSKIIFFPFLHL